MSWQGFNDIFFKYFAALMIFISHIFLNIIVIFEIFISTIISDFTITALLSHIADKTETSSVSINDSPDAFCITLIKAL